MKKTLFVVIFCFLCSSAVLAAEGVNRDELKELMGQAYMAEKNYDKAIREYQDILTKDPGNTKARTELADILSWKKQYSEAIAEYERVLQTKPDDIEVKKKLANVYVWDRNYSKALLLYQELVTHDPQDMGKKLSLAEVLIRLGKPEEAKQLVEEILEKDPQDRNARVLLADICAGGGDFKKALELYQKVLDEKYDRKVKVKIGDVLSWTRHYRKALKIYDELLAEKEEKELRLQKARILGWDKKYRQATKEYREILSQGPDELVAKEMKAKRLYWDSRVKRAITAYKELIQAMPDNSEAMFDLSQIYSYQAMWQEAIVQYKKILDIFFNHFRAREGLRKAELLLSHSVLTSGYEFFRARSGARDVDIHKNALAERLDIPLNERTNLELDYKFVRRSFIDFHNLTENQARIGIDYRESPNWSAGVFFNLVTYYTNVAPVYEFGGKFEFRTFDVGQMTLSAEQMRLENNSEVIRQRTMRDDFKARQDIDLTKRWKTGADYTFSYFSDHNNCNEVGADTLYYVTLEPKALYLKYRFFFRNFERRDDYYFAPHNYSMHELSVRWRHFLNKEEIFFGANDLYYEVGYDFLMDSTGIIGHRVVGGLAWDITKRLQMKGEGQYTHSTTKIYQDAGAKASLKYFF